MSHSSVKYDTSGVSAPAAVCVLFCMKAGEPCVLMIKRGSTLSHHSGEWAFPGGMSEESDESPCLLYTSPSPRDLSTSRMPSSA